MAKNFAEYDAQYLNANRAKHISFLPTSQGRKSKSSSSWSNARNLLSGQHRRKDSEESRSTSAATSRSSTANSSYEPFWNGHVAAPGGPLRDACAKAQEYTPTSDVAEWAHQMHIKQRQTYWWCQGCFPIEMSEPLEIPKAVEKAITGRRVRTAEPATAYD